MSFGPSYEPVTDSYLDLYNEHKDGIEQEIRSKHEVPDDFELKPVAYSSRPICGLDFRYKVALPNYQYVNVLFSASGIILPGEDDTKVSFYVDDRLSSSFYNDY